jgi:hypothetical protein
LIPVKSGAARIVLMILALCVVGRSLAGAASTTTEAADAAGHPLSSYVGSFSGLARGKPESINIMLQGKRLYVATHGWWVSCWIAKPDDGGMVIVQGSVYAEKSFNVDTSWVLSLEHGGIRAEDAQLGGPTRVYHFKRESQKANLSMMSDELGSCLPH